MAVFDSAVFDSAVFDVGATVQTIRAALVNTMSEVPPMAHYPRQDRNTTSWLEVGAYVQKAWTDSRLEKRIVAPEQLHLYDDLGVQQSTAEPSPPSGWYYAEYDLALDNDETDWEIRSGTTELATVRPFHGFFSTGKADGETFSGSGASVSADVGLDGLELLAYIDANGKVVIRREDRQLNVLETIETGLAADWVEIRIAKWRNVQQVRLYIETGGAIVRYTSDDGCQTWSASATLSATGMKPTACIGFGGIEFVYWIDGTDIKGRRYDAQLTALEVAFTAVSGGVDADGVAATVAPIQGGGNRIVIRYVSSGVLTSKTSRDGVTFV